MGKKWIYISAFAGIALLMLLPLIYIGIGSMTYSEGERSGTVTKISNAGFPIRTWEGELEMGGYQTGGNNVWSFSVLDENVVKSIQEAERAGKRCTLKYRQQMWVQSWKGKTSYFVTEVIPKKE
jgi:hypothetical protein